MERKTAQYLMPSQFENGPSNSYNIYPSFQIEEGAIHLGLEGLAQALKKNRIICIDGYVGIDWQEFIEKFSSILSKINCSYAFIDIRKYLKNKKEIEQMVRPFLGEEDPVFGKLFQGSMSDFFKHDINGYSVPDQPTIFYGTGAALFQKKAALVYIDVPKNEVQYRSRAGKVHCLGMDHSIPPKAQYKRMFFVDWPVLNRHKKTLINKIDFQVDFQYLKEPTWCTKNTFLAALKSISKNAFRVRPWFESGVWGGDWIKHNIDGLNQDVVNYAWSFECIVPENGIVISWNGLRLEFSFDYLMFYNNNAVLGDAAVVFGDDFPIRFDFLDTFNGANLSLQCHPSPSFIMEQFSEKFTQDETYYMLEAAPDATVYLGFQADINKTDFQAELLESAESGSPVNVEKYVQKHKAKKHDLFLIPHGTVHCSGRNALVLEISSTPYIYTFKMYDWLRTDLDGNPRPLNIERAMQNLNFDCKGKEVKRDYISKEKTIARFSKGRIIKLPTHKKHFYEVFRVEFLESIAIEQLNQCHILSLVEGEQIKVITNNRELIINYAETFIIPAATCSYELVNLGNSEVKVIRANVKSNTNNNEI